jgi:hypothetical protein
MTEVLKVSESLKSLIYGPTCSTQSAEDRAIVIEDQLGELFTIGTTLEEIEEERDGLKADLEERDGELQECRETMAALIAAIEGLQLSDNDGATIGTLIVGKGTAFAAESKRALADALSLARVEADKA